MEKFVGHDVVPGAQGVADEHPFAYTEGRERLSPGEGMHPMPTEQPAATPGRSLVEDHLFDRLVAAIRRDHGHDYALSVRIMDQALAFLGTCARSNEALAPSALVDHGWHTFILYTEHYRDFCQREAGQFIDHVPDDPTDIPTPEGLIDATVDAIAAAGFSVDRELWNRVGDCKNKCTGRCHHCGKPSGTAPAPRTGVAVGAGF